MVGLSLMARVVATVGMVVGRSIAWSGRRRPRGRHDVFIQTAGRPWCRVPAPEVPHAGGAGGTDPRRRRGGDPCRRTPSARSSAWAGCPSPWPAGPGGVRWATTTRPSPSVGRKATGPVVAVWDVADTARARDPRPQHRGGRLRDRPVPEPAPPGERPTGWTNGLDARPAPARSPTIPSVATTSPGNGSPADGAHLDSGAATGLPNVLATTRGSAAWASTSWPTPGQSTARTGHVLPWPGGPVGPAAVPGRRLRVGQPAGRAGARAGQRSVLPRCVGCSAPGGVLVATVPARHWLSLLDLDNAKLRWPRAHAAVYVARFGRDRYLRRFVDLADGSGVTSRWSGRATPTTSRPVPGQLRLRVRGDERSGANLWWQLVHPVRLLGGRRRALDDRRLGGRARRALVRPGPWTASVTPGPAVAPDPSGPAVPVRSGAVEPADGPGGPRRCPHPPDGGPGGARSRPLRGPMRWKAATRDGHRLASFFAQLAVKEHLAPRPARPSAGGRAVPHRKLQSDVRLLRVLARHHPPRTHHRRVAVGDRSGRGGRDPQATSPGASRCSRLMPRNSDRPCPGRGGSRPPPQHQRHPARRAPAGRGADGRDPELQHVGRRRPAEVHDRIRGRDGAFDLTVERTQ